MMAGSGITTAAEVLRSVTDGHDELYDLAFELGADPGDLRGLLDDLVRIGWLTRRNCDGVSRFEVTSSAH